jgi:hypothetical protein
MNYMVEHHSLLLVHKQSCILIPEKNYYTYVQNLILFFHRFMNLAVLVHIPTEKNAKIPYVLYKIKFLVQDVNIITSVSQ